MVAAALRAVAGSGRPIAAAVMVGGTEKLPAGGAVDLGGVPVIVGDNQLATLERAIRDHEPAGIIDLSDEPVLDYRKRHALASLALHYGVTYEGPGFRFSPPPRPVLCAKPSVAIVGTGKRTGKTALAGYAARSMVEAGHVPVVVAMGRGGPEEPEVLAGTDIDLTPQELIAWADAGKHAASDYVEDALLGRVTTVGCRRCGGGLAGGVEISNVRRGVELANGTDATVIVLEGSGSALPPVRADVTVLVVPASIPEEYLAGYFGLYRLLLADLVVVTMGEYPFGTPSQISTIISLVRGAYRSQGNGGDIQVVRTVFRPSPTRKVRGAAVFVATTAPRAAGESIKRHLEDEYGCSVVGISHSLSDRARLAKDLSMMSKGGAEVLLCEIKAAGIDVASRQALDEGMDVVYMDNVPIGVDGDDVKGAIEWAASEAVRRFEDIR